MVNNVIKVAGSLLAICALGLMPLTSGVQAQAKKETLLPNTKRLYINISESEKIVLPKSIDEYRSSTSGILRLVQPSDNVILVEALRVGKSTVTLVSGEEVFRYIVTTFENRGADSLNIENAFIERGLKNLKISFAQDQAAISGYADTQEQIDEAVEIVRKYTPFVLIRATVGKPTEEADKTMTPEEIQIAKTIEDIAGVKGLKVKVKFQQETNKIVREQSKVKGTPLGTTQSSNQQLGTSTITQGFISPPSNDPNNPQSATGVTEGTVETTKVEQLAGLPEKIFLFGDVEDDLQSAKAIRVARTFSPLVVSFLNVKDPIQIRFEARIIEVNLTKARSVGFSHPSSMDYRLLSAGTATGGSTSMATIFRKVFSGENSKFMENLTAGLRQDQNVTIQLLDQTGVGKVIQSPSITVYNGQHGYFNTGGSIPITSNTISNGVVTSSTDYRSFGITLAVFPLNLHLAGPGDINGVTEDILNSDLTRTIPSFNEVKGLADRVGNQRYVPFLDDTLKMVNENGKIAVRVLTTISSVGPEVVVGATPVAPRFEQKLLATRSILDDGEPLVIGGVRDFTSNQSVNKVPFLGDIPLIGGLFTNRREGSNSNPNIDREIVIVLTPTIVRKNTPDKRLPTPTKPETRDLMLKDGLILPQIKPQRFESSAVQIRAINDAQANSGDALPVQDSAHVTPTIQTSEGDSTSPLPQEVNLQDVDAAPKIQTISTEPVKVETTVQEKNSDSGPEVIKENSEIEKLLTPLETPEKTKVRPMPEAPEDAGIIKESPDVSTTPKTKKRFSSRG